MSDDFDPENFQIGEAMAEALVNGSLDLFDLPGDVAARIVGTSGVLEELRMMGLGAPARRDSILAEFIPIDPEPPAKPLAPDVLPLVAPSSDTRRHGAGLLAAAAALVVPLVLLAQMLFTVASVSTSMTS